MRFAAERIGEVDLVIAKVKHRDEVTSSAEIHAHESGQPDLGREIRAEIEARRKAAITNVASEIPGFRSAGAAIGGAGDNTFFGWDAKSVEYGGHTGRATSRDSALKTDIASSIVFEDAVGQRLHQGLDIRNCAAGKQDEERDAAQGPWNERSGCPGGRAQKQQKKFGSCPGTEGEEPRAVWKNVEVINPNGKRWQRQHGEKTKPKATAGDWPLPQAG